MLRWYPDRLLQGLLAVTYAPVVFGAVLALRCLCLPETLWRVGPFGGRGVDGDYGVLLAAVALGAGIVTLGWRGAGRSFRWLFVAWHLGLAGASVATAFTTDGWTLRGAGVGLVLSLDVLGPLVTLTTFAAALFWVVRDELRGDRGRSVSPLGRANAIAAAAAGVTLAGAVTVYLTDGNQLGTIGSAVAFWLAYYAVRPANPSEELHRMFASEGSTPK